VLIGVEAVTWGGTVAEAGGLVRVLPVMIPLEASSMTLDEMEGTAVTGHTVSVSTMVSVTITVESASVGKVDRSSVFAGQSMTSGAHWIMVRTDVVDTVRVVIPAPVPFVGKGAALVTIVGASVDTPVDRGTVAVLSGAMLEAISVPLV
jgi:hypothetical protein